MKVIDLFDLTGKKTIVTGAASGIGKAVAEVLHEQGAEIVLIDVSENVFNVSKELSQSGSKSYGIQVDLSKRSELKSGFIKAIEKLKTLDILVNAAGILIRTPSVDCTLEIWDKTIEINLTALFEMCKLAGKIMLERGGGKIINIASYNSIRGTSKLQAYCASKGGVNLLTMSLADEWSGKGIYVNAIAPGYIETNLSKDLRSDPIGYHKSLETIPLGRWGTAEDLKGPVLFLASKASDYITGALLIVDGGRNAYS
jgi:2-deoxy-D-gluconate 3-dehydrogenase